jgi:S1-C subfamily serine protease
MRMRMPMPDMGEMPRFDYRFEGPGGHFGMMFDRRMGDLDLVDLNPDLGDYFGVKQGVLVVKTPTDSTSPLKAGDVILKIDGREPKTVSQAARILGSYDGGEVAKFEVMRKLKRLTLSWTVPERKERSWRWKTPDGDGERVRIERT